MLDRRKLRLVCFACVLLLSLSVFAVSAVYHHQLCMGVRVVGAERLQGCRKDLTVDVGSLTFCGEAVAADVASQTIYLSQPEGDLSHPSRLMGELGTSEKGRKLYFIQSDELEDLPAAVRDGAPLRLAVVEGDRYGEVQVVVSILPVLRLEGLESAGTTIPGFPITRGRVTLFAGYNESTGGLSAHSYPATWHKRGVYSSSLDKPPLKLALKTPDDTPIDVDFLGLGKDDDWLLNAMRIDDTKVREKVMIDAWNQYIATPQTRMSTGKYVEVVIDDAYSGLYMLQRRVDEKFLALDRQRDILFKGINTWEAAILEHGYEIIYSGVDRGEAYAQLADMMDHFRYDLENFADVNLMVHFLHAVDNAGYKNMFYLLRPSEDGPTLYLLPWDTDASMGIMYADGQGMKHQFDTAITIDRFRHEYKELKKVYPHFEDLCAQRWRTLRGSMYDLPELEERIPSNADLLQRSGAYARDVQRWGLWSENDTWDELIRWCRERIQRLDAIYLGEP